MKGDVFSNNLIDGWLADKSEIEARSRRIACECARFGRNSSCIAAADQTARSTPANL